MASTSSFGSPHLATNFNFKDAKSGHALMKPLLNRNLYFANYMNEHMKLSMSLCTKKSSCFLTIGATYCKQSLQGY